MLRENVNLTAFFSAVNRCKGEVIFLSAEGDQMNLKSTLCQYLFTSAYLHREIRLDGTISCGNPEDAVLLEPFLK